ncbi:MAG TPA: hypothetical protein DG577_09660 [Firmicutes bacterium]|nr:hypothetical protein [Bacillota bacterium]
MAQFEERRKVVKELFDQRYTQKEIAEKLGMSKSTISRYLK